MDPSVWRHPGAWSPSSGLEGPGHAGPRVTEAVLSRLHSTGLGGRDTVSNGGQWEGPRAREEVEGAMGLGAQRGQLLEGLAGGHLVSCQG